MFEESHCRLLEDHLQLFQVLIRPYLFPGLLCAGPSSRKLLEQTEPNAMGEQKEAVSIPPSIRVHAWAALGMHSRAALWTHFRPTTGHWGIGGHQSRMLGPHPTALYELAGSLQVYPPRAIGVLSSTGLLLDSCHSVLHQAPSLLPRPSPSGGDHVQREHTAFPAAHAL